MRLSALLATLICAALIVGGCGGGGSSTGGGSTGPKKATAPNAPAGSKVVACGGGDAQLRTVGIGCDTARTTMRRWQGTPSCALRGDTSRGSCALGDLRCQALRADRGIAVSCARAGADIAFVAVE